MKAIEEINNEIKVLQRKMSREYKNKQRAKSESADMQRIDNRIDRLGAKIKALQWVKE